MRSGQRLVEIDASGQVTGVVTTNPLPVSPFQGVEPFSISLLEGLGGGDGFAEMHGCSHSAEPPTTSATTLATRPLNSVSPPQPASAASSEPGSRSEMSRASPDFASK